MPPELWGPGLYFRGRRGDAWSVTFAVLLRCPTPGGDDASPAATLTLKTAPSGTAVPAPARCGVDCGTEGRYVLVSWDVVFPLPEAPSAVEYAVAVSGTGAGDTTLGPFRLAVPAAGKEPRTLFFSCNDAWATDLQHDRYLGFKAIHDTWLAPTVAPEAMCHVGVGLGDQIYGDDVLELPDLSNAAAVTGYYARAYFKRFGEEHMARAMATLPMAMQPDDHDWHNGFGCIPAPERPHENVAHAAARLRFVFQDGRDPAGAVAADGHALTNVSDVLRLGPSCVMVRPDMRSNREHESKQMMSLATVKKLEADVRAEVAAGKLTQHLIVNFAVPVAWSNCQLLEQWWEKARPPGGPKSREKAVGYGALWDLSPSAYALDATAEIVHLLHRVTEDTKTRMTIISGDVHVSGHGVVYTKDGPGEAKDHR